MGEILYTDNVSIGGAGLSGSVLWRPGEQVLIKAVRMRFTAEGRIVYSRPTQPGRFVTGIEVVSRHGDWSR